MPPTRQSLVKLPLPPNVFLMLVALADGPAHGYRLRAELIERSNGTVKLDPGSLYRLISRLLDEGVIAETTGEDADDERRRYYRITAEGRRILLSETRRLADLVASVQTAMARRQKS
jgi:DNA-binding PadR family transcriptional regulator